MLNQVNCFLKLDMSQHGHISAIKVPTPIKIQDVDLSLTSVNKEKDYT
jgi:hypothetical protein